MLWHHRVFGVRLFLFEVRLRVTLNAYDFLGKFLLLLSSLCVPFLLSLLCAIYVTGGLKFLAVFKLELRFEIQPRLITTEKQST